MFKNNNVVNNLTFDMHMYLEFGICFTIYMPACSICNIYTRTRSDIKLVPLHFSYVQQFL